MKWSVTKASISKVSLRATMKGAWERLYFLNADGIQKAPDQEEVEMKPLLATDL